MACCARRRHSTRAAVGARELARGGGGFHGHRAVVEAARVGKNKERVPTRCDGREERPTLEVNAAVPAPGPHIIAADDRAAAPESKTRVQPGRRPGRRKRPPPTMAWR